MVRIGAGGCAGLQGAWGRGAGGGGGQAPTHGCCWETFYTFACCGLVGNPHSTAKIQVFAPSTKQCQVSLGRQRPVLPSVWSRVAPSVGQSVRVLPILKDRVACVEDPEPSDGSGLRSQDYDAWQSGTRKPPTYLFSPDLPCASRPLQRLTVWLLGLITPRAIWGGGGFVGCRCPPCSKPRRTAGCGSMFCCSEPRREVATAAPSQLRRAWRLKTSWCEDLRPL